MKALVVGGTRFVGLHLVRHLHSLGHEVTVLNRGQTSADLPPEVKRLRADRGEPSQVRSALKGATFDYAFDTSGYTPGEVTPFIRGLDGRVELYVFCSTRSVYAPSDLSPITEDFPLERRPETIEYVKGKVACEDALMEAHHRRGFPAVIMRPPYIYGPDDHNWGRGFSIFARLTQGRKVIIPSDGRTHTHFLHVDDFAEAFASAIGRPQAIGQAYNVAGRYAITSDALVGTIAQAMGVRAEIAHIPPEEYAKIKPAPFPFDWRESQVYSIEKAARDLQWRPRRDMLAGMAETYRWWLERGLDKERWDFAAEEEALAGWG